MKNQSARRKACPNVTLSTTNFTDYLSKSIKKIKIKRKKKNHHTMLLGMYFLTSQRITVLSRSSSRRTDVQEDGVYYIGT